MTKSNEWLCRNCNTLVAGEWKECPRCHAERGEEVASDDGDVVRMEHYATMPAAPKSKYNFREAVLVNAADILLILGLLCSFGALILPAFIPDVEYIRLWSIGGGVAIFAVSMIQWALLRSVAFISQRLRDK